jgi:hypothetical protein
MEAAVSSVKLELPYTIIFLIYRARWIKTRSKRGGKTEYKICDPNQIQTPFIQSVFSHFTVPFLQTTK